MRGLKLADTRNESVLLLHENHLEWIKHWERSSFLGERALFSARIAVKRENANSRYLNTGHFVANLLTVWADAVRLRRNSLGTRHGARTSLSTSLFVRYRCNRSLLLMQPTLMYCFHHGQDDSESLLSLIAHREKKIELEVN